MSKVFCIGLPKTGTTSMGKAFEMLGYKHNARTSAIEGIRNLFVPTMGNKYINDQLAEYEAFEDSPWHFMYRHLHMRFPSAKFILTIRKDNDPAIYFESFVYEKTRKIISPIHQFKKIALFGVPYVDGNRDIVESVYRSHNSAVMKYFSHYPEDFLIFETGVDGWNKLCPFLGKKTPSEPYPWLNRRPI